MNPCAALEPPFWCLRSTPTEFKRKIRAATRTAKEAGATEVEIKTVGDEIVVRISLAPDQPLADPRPNDFDQVLGLTSPFEPVPVPTTTLYRYFDKDGRLIYVGITRDVWRREAEHSCSHWFHLSVRKETEEYSSRYKAEQAELQAIQDKKPLYNVVGQVA